ncbi:MAG: rod shape-determining protein MreD [Pseudomonadota bacterium]|nr:rod shape-determining protein MreD [Pseudomonadota bacterium]MEC8378619.1 rod shape-determining protein MreD [Pseudomonadota bacterium]
MTEFLDQKRKTLPIYFTIGITILIFSFFEIILRNSIPLFLNIPLTLMCLIYWNMALPKSVGLFWAILTGLILDVSQDIILGSNVLIFLISSYLIQRYFHRLRALFRIQQSLIVAAMVFIYQIIFIFFLLNFSFEIFKEVIFLTFISLITWPIIYGILRFIRIRFTYVN